MPPLQPHSVLLDFLQTERVPVWWRWRPTPPVDDEHGGIIQLLGHFLDPVLRRWLDGWRRVMKLRYLATYPDLSDEIALSRTEMVSRLLLIAACADGAMQNAFSVAINGLPKPLFVNVAASLETHKADFIRGRGPDPFGLLCWPAAQVVCEALVDRARGLQADSSMDLSHSLSGTRVLEVGAGTGLCSLAAASLGVQVTATDAHPEPLAQLEAAAAAQGLDVETYCWRLEQARPHAPATAFL